MTNLSDIIERLEKAEAGSRELDALIWCHFAAVKYSRHNVPYGGGAETQVEFTVPPKRTRMVTGKGRGSNPMYQHAEPVTTSVDAAISLAEKVLPKWSIRLGLSEGYKFPVVTMGRSYPTNKSVSVEHHTSPLALCIAILKAKAQQQEGGE